MDNKNPDVITHVIIGGLLLLFSWFLYKDLTYFLDRPSLVSFADLSFSLLLVLCSIIHIAGIILIGHRNKTEPDLENKPLTSGFIPYAIVGYAVLCNIAWFVIKVIAVTLPTPYGFCLVVLYSIAVIVVAIIYLNRWLQPTESDKK